MRSRRVVHQLGVTLLFALTLAAARADEYRPAYLQLSESQPDVFQVLWKVPARGDRRLRLDVRIEPGVEKFEPVRSSLNPGEFIQHWSLRADGGLAGRKILIDGLPALSTEVLVRIAYLNGATETARLTPASPAFTITGSPQRLAVVNTYMVFGVEHILQGFDHLLFVACLVFIAGSWRRILLTITGFTLAHSITLTLASLQLVELPISPIEATIALSIVFLAREIAVGQKKSLTWRYPVLVSSTFGLLHGFGFASALSEVGLPQTEIPAALLAFNIGVELGQILFVACLLILFGVLSRVGTLLDRRLVSAVFGVEKTAAYVVGSIAMFWTIERVSGFLII